MDKHLNWKFDISTFRLLGRELITDRITALVELVKNSYDANATEVYIELVNTSSLERGRIIISDNGIGMSSSDIENKWMVIGTSSKRDKKVSEDPFRRKYVGEKGVGRFAIDKLGGKCQVLSKKKGENVLNRLSIDWMTYEQNTITKDFNKVDNTLKQREFLSHWSGVRLKITHIHDVWTKDDINRLFKEMSKIVSPLANLNCPFSIYVLAGEFQEYSVPKLVQSTAIKFASEEINLSFNKELEYQERLKFEHGELTVSRSEKLIFGYINIQLYYFDQGAKGNFAKNYKGAELEIDGIKIYRDGILATPFAEHEADSAKKRDILGIDKRRYSGFFDKVSSRDLIGVVEISKELCPKIIDATNRQNFLDNEEYRQLKVFIVDQLRELEKFLTFNKKKIYETSKNKLGDAKRQLGNFSSELKNLKNILKDDNLSTSDANLKIKELENAARQADIALKKGIQAQKKEQEESRRKEDMFMSLMSLQNYALEITHIIKTSLGVIKRRAEFNKKYWDSPNLKLQVAIEQYHSDIVDEVTKLDKAIDFMSSYTRSHKHWEYFSVQNAIKVIFNAYKPIFEKEQIKAEIFVDNNVQIRYNETLFGDIIKNLLSNSIKALSGLENKLIKISALDQNAHLEMIVSDNGAGIPDVMKDKLFDIYQTTTSEDGGNGMGLFMVRTNLEAVKGTIEVIKPEFNKGSSFKVYFPFKKEE